ncbi:2-oxoglutarate and iron-dependent oxygenase domain-containing protein [Streptomyces sp. NPDC048172]|uniref:2-oxoglutarate and iron-dependent oxygenase domain-containing protein n=1 Tax=Streptomyces sp. NPDC048172 TaxID=3365505 RepID=UPI0037128948
MGNDSEFVPVVDLSAGNGERGRISVAREIGRACESSGFFTVVGHGVPEELTGRVYAATPRSTGHDAAARTRPGRGRTPGRRSPRTSAPPLPGQRRMGPHTDWGSLTTTFPMCPADSSSTSAT